MLLTGMLADKLANEGWSKTRVRKVFQSIAFLTPAAALLVLANPSISPHAAVTCLTCALGVTSLGQQSPNWTHQHMRDRHGFMHCT